MTPVVLSGVSKEFALFFFCTSPMVRVWGWVRYPPQSQTTCPVYIHMLFTSLALGLQCENVSDCVYCFSALLATFSVFSLHHPKH